MKKEVTIDEILYVEVERIKNILINYKNQILQYDELMVRTFVKHIKVMPDRTLILILKGGLEIVQKI